MIFHHRRSLFPFVIAGLTIGLAVLMYYAFTGRMTPRASVVSEPPPISVSEYTTNLKNSSEMFLKNYVEQSEVSVRLVLVDETLQTLLDMRVPAEYKNLHLSFVIELHNLQQALKGQGEDAQVVFAKIEDLLNDL